MLLKIKNSIFRTNHFFKSRSSDIVLLKLGNLNQNAKRYEARNTEREARDEDVRAKRADFFLHNSDN